MDVYNIFKKYKIRTKEKQIFDPIRNKFVAMTPEEQVRQRTIQFLIHHVSIPIEKLKVEVSLNSLGSIGNRKRIDIGVFDENDHLCGIVECKANYIGKGEAPYMQAIDYADTLAIRFYFVSDGRDFIGYYYSAENDQYIQLDTLPTYDELLHL